MKSNVRPIRPTLQIPSPPTQAWRYDVRDMVRGHRYPHLAPTFLAPPSIGVDEALDDDDDFPDGAA
jgi:hypothetical protein